MNCAALVVAGGSGRRFGTTRPKQFQLLRGKPLLLWTLDAFESSPHVDSIVLVIPAEEREETARLLKEHGLGRRVQLCDGGAERVDSVRNGLEALPRKAKLVAVHDAARPLVTSDLIARVVQAATEVGAAIAALPATDTIKLGRQGRIDKTIARGRVHAAQTPQVFNVSLLRKAYQAWDEAGRPAVTDDAQLVELLGKPVQLVTGDARNIKVTVADDLVLAEAWLSKNDLVVKLPRTGVGYDVHRLAAGRPLILGGVQIEHERGLEGHSDADVLAHAISDALLGAACLGDIGQHFPPDDPRYKGADSIKLLARVRELVHQVEYRVAHVDSVVACQAPKLKPHIAAMRSRLAAALQLDERSVSVKATTTEGLGAIGRAEGIAAYATATLVPRL
jgi:2-C-methyl-D-erythritol 4-phosphate cytidylyltransferase/2-C-methyl-D-erythritol 2,4-cyclodiphosphate synthase